MNDETGKFDQEKLREHAAIRKIMRLTGDGNGKIRQCKG